MNHIGLSTENLSISCLYILLCILLMVILISDLKYRRIPNIITFPAATTALVYHYILNGLNGFLFSLLGLALCFSLFIVPYLRNMIGAGDVKLVCMIGAALGVNKSLNAILLSCIIGGFMSIAVIMYHRAYFKGIIYDFRIAFMSLLTIASLKHPLTFNSKPNLPYGVAISIGTMLSISLDLMGYSLI